MSTDAESPHQSGSVPGFQRFTQVQFGGVIALLVGVSQMLVGTVVLDGLLTVVVAWGGGLLVLIGTNLIQNRSAFHNGWKEDGMHGLLSLLFLTVTTAFVLVAAGLVLVG